LQTNYFSRPKIPGANSASGNEVLHDLGFDAADTWAVYTFKWTHGKVQWFVNGKHIRTATWKANKPVPLQSYSTCRVVVNAWPVSKPAEEWAGPLDPHFDIATAKYRWMRYDEGESVSDFPQEC
jgi:endo-1,3-1,4-beta-glycanase ExoK